MSKVRNPAIAEILDLDGETAAHRRRVEMQKKFFAFFRLYRCKSPIPLGYSNLDMYSHTVTVSVWLCTEPVRH